jgi:hypothetical protein
METEKRCKHHSDGEVKLVLTPDGCHHGKWVCSECEKFVVWSKSPKTSEELDQRQNEIRDLMRESCLGMDDDDLHKLLKLYTKPHLSPFDQAHIVAMSQI